MISVEQQRDLDALTAKVYDAIDGKISFADYRKAEKEYIAKYGGN